MNEIQKNGADIINKIKEKYHCSTLGLWRWLKEEVGNDFNGKCIAKQTIFHWIANGKIPPHYYKYFEQILNKYN